mmetsp:Transcript_9449/g.23175  ORF Transcript_9449/g.23175 Transcript_9449/m.23175 type:complete len:607 (+) Transcript_9449:1954-3774(+)
MKKRHVPVFLEHGHGLPNKQRVAQRDVGHVFDQLSRYLSHGAAQFRGHVFPYQFLVERLCVQPHAGEPRLFRETLHHALVAGDRLPVPDAAHDCQSTAALRQLYVRLPLQRLVQVQKRARHHPERAVVRDGEQVRAALEPQRHQHRFLLLRQQVSRQQDDQLRELRVVVERGLWVVVLGLGEVLGEALFFCLLGDPRPSQQRGHHVGDQFLEPKAEVIGGRQRRRGGGGRGGSMGVRHRGYDGEEDAGSGVACSGNRGGQNLQEATQLVGGETVVEAPVRRTNRTQNVGKNPAQLTWSHARAAHDGDQVEFFRGDAGDVFCQLGLAQSEPANKHHRPPFFEYLVLLDLHRRVFKLLYRLAIGGLKMGMLTVGTLKKIVLMIGQTQSRCSHRGVVFHRARLRALFEDFVHVRDLAVCDRLVALRDGQFGFAQHLLADDVLAPVGLQIQQQIRASRELRVHDPGQVYFPAHRTLPQQPFRLLPQRLEDRDQSGFALHLDLFQDVEIELGLRELVGPLADQNALRLGARHQPRGEIHRIPEHGVLHAGGGAYHAAVVPASCDAETGNQVQLEHHLPNVHATQNRADGVVRVHEWRQAEAEEEEHPLVVH